MHELSIAVDLVDLASRELSRLGPVRVRSVRLRLGAFSGVVADALRFSFDLAASGSAVDGAQLLIEEVPASFYCRTCAVGQPASDLACRRCPRCQGSAVELSGGREIELVSLEIEDQ